MQQTSDNTLQALDLDFYPTAGAGQRNTQELSRLLPDRFGYLKAVRSFFARSSCPFTLDSLLQEPVTAEIKMLVAASALIESLRKLSEEYEETLKTRTTQTRPLRDFQQLRLDLSDVRTSLAIADNLSDTILCQSGQPKDWNLLSLVYCRSIKDTARGVHSILEILPKRSGRVKYFNHCRLCLEDIAPLDHILNAKIAELEYAGEKTPLALEHPEFRSPMNRFCTKELKPNAKEIDESGKIPDGQIAKIAASGFIQPFFTQKAPDFKPAVAIEELAGACANSAWQTFASAVLTAKILEAFGTEKHKAQWLPSIVAGTKIGCIAIAEDIGTNFNGYTTNMTPTDDGFILNGAKHKITNAPVADMAMVYVNVNSQPEKITRTYALVDLKQDGITIESISKIGLRALPWGSIRFENVFVPKEDLINLADLDTNEMLKAVEWGQLCQSACCIGIAEAALSETVAFVRGRQSGGVAIAELQAVRNKIAVIRTKIETARALTYKAATIMQSGRSAKEIVGMAKIIATENGITGCNLAMELLGGHALNTDYGVQRHWRDVQGSLAAGLTADSLRDSLVCARLGISDQWSHSNFDWSNSTLLQKG